jgi:hypothetical protein
VNLISCWTLLRHRHFQLLFTSRMKKMIFLSVSKPLK